MKPESIVFAVAGMCFGVILGWVIGAQQPARPVAPAPAPAAASAGSPPQAAPVLDEGRVQALMTIVENDPGNAGARTELGNVYFDAERFTDAIQWYERSLAIDPNNADVSTDLGVSYFYTDRPDEALAQFDRSLQIDPTHTKTMLNQGIVLAFGKEDLGAAAESWKRVVELSPESAEGEAARRALEGVAAAHAGQTTNNQ
jgi:tetratricopeptide (TPR) repeat protein